MPVIQCSNGKYRIGKGPCMYKSLEKAEKAYKAYLAKKHSKNFTESTLTSIYRRILNESYPVDVNDEEYFKDLGERIGIKWDEEKFTPKDLGIGFEVELEHGRIDSQTDVTDNDVMTTAKIAWAHLNERPDYYDLLLKHVEKNKKRL